MRIPENLGKFTLLPTYFIIKYLHNILMYYKMHLYAIYAIRIEFEVIQMIRYIFHMHCRMKST